MKHAPEEAVFLVCTHGWSGSNWLALALDRHRRIACSHNVLYDRRPGPGDSDRHVWESGLHRVIRQRNQTRYEHGVDEVAAWIRGEDPRVCYGNVGYFRARDFPVLAARFGPNRRPVRVVNLVRDPVAVVWSGFGQFRRRFRYDLAEFHWNLGKVMDRAELVAQVTGRFGVVVGEVDHLAFLAAALALFSLGLDVVAVERLRTTGTFHFGGSVRLEDIGADQERFRHLLELLAPGLAVDADCVRQAVGRPPVNVHNDQRVDSPARKHGLLEPWQQFVLGWCFRRSGIADFYSGLGYDHTYID